MMALLHKLQFAETPMSQTLASRQIDDTMAGVDASVVKTVQRLGKISRYEPPKVISFPIDGVRVAGPVSLSGNCY
jgi:hypothetical protein